MASSGTESSPVSARRYVFAATTVKQGRLSAELPRACDRCRRRKTRCDQTPCKSCVRAVVACTHLLPQHRPGRHSKTRQQESQRLNNAPRTGPAHGTECSDGPSTRLAEELGSEAMLSRTNEQRATGRSEAPDTEELTLGRGLGFGGDYGLHVLESAQTNSPFESSRSHCEDAPSSSVRVAENSLSPPAGGLGGSPWSGGSYGP